MQAAPPTNEERFEEVWRTVHDKFFDPKFNGVNWDQAHQDYGPLAARAQSAEEFANVVNTMLAELHTSHTHLYTAHEPEYFQICGIFWPFLEPELKPFLPEGKLRYSGIGIATATLQGKVFIRSILDRSPAAQAGLRTGDEIVSVGGMPFEPVGSFAGKANQAVQMRIRRTAEANPVDVSVTPQFLDPATLFLDAMKASVEVTDHDGVKVGYLHVWSYAGRVYQPQVEEELAGRLRGADALVLDLRDGWGGADVSYLWPFLAPPFSFTMTDRDGKETVHKEAWTKPVCLLVNGEVRSGKELLTFFFKKARRGPVVGSRTAGAFMGGQPFVLHDGSLLYLAVNDVTADGNRLEGVGVPPDVEAPFKLEYANGADPQKARAVEVIVQSVQRQQKSIQ